MGRWCHRKQATVDTGEVGDESDLPAEEVHAGSIAQAIVAGDGLRLGEESEVQVVAGGGGDAHIGGSLGKSTTLCMKVDNNGTSMRPRRRTV